MRWLIVTLLLAVSTQAFATRFSMSTAVHRIQIDLGLSNVQVGWVLSAFVAGYAVPQFPVGLVVDWLGLYRVLLVSVIAWSSFTVLTGAVRWLPLANLALALIVLRFLAGIGQAGVLTCSIKTIGRWMPLGERATANGFFMMGLGLGGALAPPLIVRLVAAYGWPVPFLVFGLAGLALAALWRAYGADYPERHPRVNAAELAYIQRDAEYRSSPAVSAASWRGLFRSRSVWALALSYGSASYASYVFFTWFFLYVVNVRKMDLISGGWWAALPYVGVALGTPAGGRVSDFLTLRLGKRRGRLLVVLIGEGLAAALIAAGGRVEGARLSIVLLALATGLHMFSQASSWAAAIDLAPGQAGALFGVMNTLAQVAGTISPILTPAIADRYGWIAALDFAAATAALAGFLWLFVNPERPAVPA